jgi:hypothetical protein
MRFMRGKYRVDEVGNGKDELKFRIGGKTVLTILIREDRFDFVIIFGKTERERFEQERDSFPKAICDIYDSTRTYHDGKWMLIPVADPETLEAVKRLVMIKKKPNRKPFPKETAIYTKCWHRCDLCVYYSGGTFSEEFRKDLCERFTRVYHVDDFNPCCPGCYVKSETEACEPLKCAKTKGLDKCHDCRAEHCTVSPVVSFLIEPKSILADDITWAVLPYIHEQCGN